MKKIMILISLIMILIGCHNVNLKILNCQKKDSKIVNDQFKTKQDNDTSHFHVILSFEWLMVIY